MKQSFVHLFSTAMAVVGLFSPGALIHAVDVRMAVSDLIADTVNPVVRSLAEREGLTVETTSTGSLPALDRMRAGEIDLAVIAHPLSARPLDSDLISMPLAYEMVVVVAPRNNPLNDLSIRQLAGIFGANEELNLTQWRELNIAEIGSRSINTVAIDHSSSMVMELFQNSVLTARVLRPGVTMMRASELEAYTATNVNAIAVLHRLPKDDRLKTIAISEERGAPAFGPTSENAYFADYPLRMPYLVVFPSSAADRVAPVMRMLLSSDVAEVLEGRDLFPVPEGARQSLLMEQRRRSGR